MASADTTAKPANKNEKIGEVVSVNGSRAKDGSNLVNASTVAFDDGKRVFGGASSADDPAT